MPRVNGSTWKYSTVFGNSYLKLCWLQIGFSAITVLLAMRSYNKMLLKYDLQMEQF